MPAIGLTSSSDQALLSALAAWAGAEGPALLLRLGHQRARALANARKAHSAADPIATLHVSHESQFAPDPSRIHPSWYVRALQDEAPSVQRIVVEAADEPLRSTLMNALRLSRSDLRADHAADPDARRVVLGLWTERLVGDALVGPDDAPALIAVASLSPRNLYRLHRLLGRAKLAYLPASALDGFRRPGPHEPQSEPIDPRLAKIASNDRAAALALGRHALAALGLTTIGRLLGRVDPYRLRWTLQHLPYAIAKRVRSVASQPFSSVPAILDWEARIFDRGLHELATSTQGRSTER